MKKIIKISLENTTNSRQIDETFCEYYSHDRNNGLFEFEITNTTLTTEKVTALFKFTRSKSYWTTDGVIEGNKIKVKFDTSLITQNEVVECHLYLDNTDEDADVFSFKFNVKISELDKAKNKPIKERYFANSMIVDVDNVLTREVLNEEIKTLKETFVNNETLPRFIEDELTKKNVVTDISNLATKDKVDEVEKKVVKLEERPSYDDSDVKQRLTALEGANFLTEHQDISNLATKKSVEDVEAKVTQLEARPSYDDSEIKREIKELKDRPVTANIDTSNFVTNRQLEDKHYLTEHQDISGLATKEQLDELRNNQPTVDTTDLVTKEQLKKAFLDEEEHEKYAKKTEIPQPYNDTDIKTRLTTLENRPAGNVDTSDFVARGDLTTLELRIDRKLNGEGSIFTNTGFKEPFQYFRDTFTGDSRNYYGKIYSNNNERIIIRGNSEYTNLDTALYTLASSIPNGYTPDFEFSEGDNLKFITTQSIHNYLSSNSGGNNGNTEKITALDNRLKVLEANTGNTTELDKRLKTIETNPANTTELDKRLKVLEAKQWEIHGRGMPNGVVTAPVGTTYVDEAVTNGALKWIKKTGTGNTGWEVLIGDTGWRTLPAVSKLGNSFVKVRRKNDTIFYQFGGLSWGWFGIVRRGGAGYQLQGSDRERNCYILGLNGVPQGFRSESSLIGGIYNDKGTPYGTWYLGGAGDSHMLRFQFTDPVPTDRDIGDIRVSSISYLTNDPWPQN